MNTKITNIVLLGVIVIAFIAGIVLYPQLPERIVSHWNASGEADGYMGKFWGTFLLPLIMVGLFGLYLLIPVMDPLKENIKSFRKAYNSFFIVMSLFFLYIFSLSTIWNLGYTFNFSTAMILAMAVLLFFLGTFLRKVKRNFFVGIRTPWTLSSDEVWNKTHKLAGRLFQAAGLVTLIGPFPKGNFAIFAIIIPAVLASLISVVYSYVIFKRLAK